MQMSRYIALMMAPKYSGQEFGTIRFQEISREEPRRPQPESGQIMQTAAQGKSSRKLVNYWCANVTHLGETQGRSIPRRVVSLWN